MAVEYIKAESSAPHSMEPSQQHHLQNQYIQVIDDFLSAATVRALREKLHVHVNPPALHGAGSLGHDGNFGEQKLTVDAETAQKLASVFAEMVEEECCVVPAKVSRGSVPLHRDYLVFEQDKPAADGWTAVVYLTGGGALILGEEKVQVEARAGRLVKWDSAVVHSFTSDDEHAVRAMLGPAAVHHGRLSHSVMGPFIAGDFTGLFVVAFGVGALGILGLAFAIKYLLGW